MMMKIFFIVLALSQEKASQPFEVRIYAFVAVQWIPIQGFQKTMKSLYLNFSLTVQSSDKTVELQCVCVAFDRLFFILLFPRPPLKNFLRRYTLIRVTPRTHKEFQVCLQSNGQTKQKQSSDKGQESWMSMFRSLLTTPGLNTCHINFIYLDTTLNNHSHHRTVLGRSECW